MRSSILNDVEAVRQALEESSSIKDSLQRLGLRAAGGNYKAFHEACKRHGLSPVIGDSHTKTANARATRTIPDEEVFVVDSTYSNRRLIKKRYSARTGITFCESCGIGPTWNGKPLVLQLDHINGIYNDHRIENLALLCPNCHSQTTTFCGRNKTV